MKQKLIAALVTSAIAGFAATTAQAGVIQATYKIYAAEVFGDADAKLTVPTVSYNLSRPVSGTVANPNNFTITLTLSAGEFDTSVAATAVLRDPSSANSLESADAGVPVYSADKKSVTFPFSANQDGITYPANSTITFGDSKVVANVKPLQVTKVNSILKTPLDNACAPTQAQIEATVKMTSASGVEVDTNDAGAIVKTPVLASNVGINVTAVSSSAYDGSVAANNEQSKINVLDPDYGTKFTTIVAPGTPDITDASKLFVNVGKVVISDRASLYDIGGAKVYSTSGAAFATDAVNDGAIAAAKLNLTVTGSFAENGTLGLFSDAACTAALTGDGNVASINTARDTATFGLTAKLADWTLASAKRSAFVCYKVDGAKTIPTSQFKLTAGSLTKGSTSEELANPVCPATLYNLVSNGVKIDVRNYIPASQSTATGWADVVRFINTDETQSADITAQLIKDDGSLLAAGKILTLPKRGFKYMSNADIEAALVAAGGATVTGQQGNNARLRITSASSSLRVQNYHVNPVTGAVTENSAAQGDDGYATDKAQNIDIPTQNNK